MHRHQQQPGASKSRDASNYRTQTTEVTPSTAGMHATPGMSATAGTNATQGMSATAGTYATPRVPATIAGRMQDNAL
jgi:hypothetical protein